MDREYFKNLPNETTPLEASRLNGFLNGKESIEKLVVGDIESKNLWTKGNIVSNRDDKVPFDDTIAAGTYTFSCDLTVTSEVDYGRGFLFIFYDTTDLSYSMSTYLTPGHNTYTFTTTSTSIKYRLYRGETYSHSSMCELTNVQLEKNNVATTIVPHKNFGYESGSNGNGSWIKYDDGTMICWKKLEGTVNVTTTWGSLYYANVTVGNFAQTFIEIPTINVVGSNEAFFVACNGTTSTSSMGNVLLVRPNIFSNMPYALNVIAIGRWK